MNLRTAFYTTLLAAGMTLPAYGYTLSSGQDVGYLDSFVAATTQSSLGNASPQTEKSWVEGVLGYSIWLEDKTEEVDLNVTQESASVVAFSLQNTPSYYLVKDSTDFMLFSNTDSLDWGVLDLNEYFGTHKLEDLQFSHVTEFGSVTVVPEPGIGTLLLVGVVGLFLARRRVRLSALAETA